MGTYHQRATAAFDVVDFVAGVSFVITVKKRLIYLLLFAFFIIIV